MINLWQVDALKYITLSKYRENNLAWQHRLLFFPLINFLNHLNSHQEFTQIIVQFLIFQHVMLLIFAWLLQESQRDWNSSASIVFPAGLEPYSSGWDRCWTTPTPIQSPNTLVTVLSRSLCQHRRGKEDRNYLRNLFAAGYFLSKAQQINRWNQIRPK